MNHFVGLLILSFCVAIAFTLLNREGTRARALYFFRLMAYMVVGSLLCAWVMYFIPW